LDQGLCRLHGKLSVLGQLVSTSARLISTNPEPLLNENQAALGLPRLAEEGVRFEAASPGAAGLS
jgi:hypothetical protein